MIKKLFKKIFYKKYIQIEICVDNYGQWFWIYLYFENKKGLDKQRIIDNISSQYETSVSYVKELRTYKTNNPEGSKINIK